MPILDWLPDRVIPVRPSNASLPTRACRTYDETLAVTRVEGGQLWR